MELLRNSPKGIVFSKIATVHIIKIRDSSQSFYTMCYITLGGVYLFPLSIMLWSGVVVHSQVLGRNAFFQSRVFVHDQKNILFEMKKSGCV